MKLQMTPQFPASVVGIGGIVVTVANGVYTFSFAGIEPTIVTADASIAAKTPAIAVQRNNPVVTNLLLPSVALQAGFPLHIIDWSTNVVNHQILLTPAVGQTIMAGASWSIFSGAGQLGSARLYPSTVLNGWYT